MGEILGYDNIVSATVNFLESFGSLMPPWFTVVRIGMWLIGLGLLVSAIMQLRRFREPGGEENVIKAGWQLFFAMLALNLDTAMVTGTQTLFGYDAQPDSPLSYMATVSGGSGGWVGERFRLLAAVILIWIQFIGYIAFARGILILNRYKTQGSKLHHVSLSKGMTHIVGGIIAANLGLFSDFLLGTT